jgi:hypothetical protein
MFLTAGYHNHPPENVMAQAPCNKIGTISSERQTAAAFLSFLSKDIESDPGKLRAFSPALAMHIASLTQDVTFDPGETIEGDVEL